MNYNSNNYKRTLIKKFLQENLRLQQKRGSGQVCLTAASHCRVTPPTIPQST
jgi:hypothetical protein